MTEIMPVPRKIILLSYQQGVKPLSFFVIMSLFSYPESCSILNKE